MICKMCGEKPCACGGYAKPAPAPLRDAREVMHETLAHWGFADECEQGRHSKACVVGQLALEADRAARQPDVAQLRELLEEGARLVCACSTAIGSVSRAEAEDNAWAWARRARKAVQKKTC